MKARTYFEYGYYFEEDATELVPLVSDDAPLSIRIEDTDEVSTFIDDSVVHINVTDADQIDPIETISTIKE